MEGAARRPKQKNGFICFLRFSDFGGILALSWLILAYMMPPRPSKTPQDASKTPQDSPSCLQDASKTLQKISKNHWLYKVFGTFSYLGASSRYVGSSLLILAYMMPPRSSKTAPGCLQDASRTLQDVSKSPILASKTPPNRSKSRPKCVQKRTWGP